MTRAELVLQLKQFIGKKSWRREDVLCRFLLERDTRLCYADAEHILARLVENGDGVEWFLPPRIEEDEDKRGDTLLHYRLTDKGKDHVQKMATHEEELKIVRNELELLEAEFEANREELYGNNDSQVESRPAPLPKRRDYLKLRNTYLEGKIGELKKKVKSKEEIIDWDNRTR